MIKPRIGSMTIFHVRPFLDEIQAARGRPKRSAAIGRRATKEISICG